MNAPYKRSDNQRTRAERLRKQQNERSISRDGQGAFGAARGDRNGREREREREGEGGRQDDNISRSLFLEHVITLPRKTSREGTRPARDIWRATSACASISLISVVSISLTRVTSRKLTRN